MAALDLWQTCGGTFNELCNLCCISKEKAFEQIGKEVCRKVEAGEAVFSDLIFINNLDYKGDGDFIDFACDGPMTHAMKEYIVHEMTTNHKLKRAAHEALADCFPELMDKALIEMTDEEGNRYLVDNSGEIVGTTGAI